MCNIKLHNEVRNILHNKEHNIMHTFTTIKTCFKWNIRCLVCSIATVLALNPIKIYIQIIPTKVLIDFIQYVSSKQINYICQIKPKNLSDARAISFTLILDSRTL